MKNYIKKFSIILCLLSVFCFSLFGCKTPNPLIERVCDLRSNIYVGECAHFSIRATYGFKETPFIRDGKIGEKVFFLEFRILNQTDVNVETYIVVNFEGKEYKSHFALDPISHSVKAKMEIENFNNNSFSATVYYGSEIEQIEFRSIVPQNAVDYKTALDKLYKDYGSLIDRYIDSENNFVGEITARIIVKDNHPYWYIGLSSSPNDTKALLIDGITTEILAVREVF